MSSLMQRTIRRVLLIVGVALLSSTPIAAAEKAEKVALKFNDKPLESVGQKACKPSGETVDIELTAKLKEKTDFQVYFKDVDEKKVDKTKITESVCDAKLSTGHKTLKMKKSEPTVPLRAFVTDGQCSDEGVSKLRAICIYEGEGGDQELLAYAVYRVETKVAQIEDITGHWAANGEVGFEVKVKGKTGSLSVETCYAKTDDVKDIDANPDPCLNPSDKIKIDSSSSLTVTISGLDPVEYSLKVRLHEDKEDPTKWHSPSFKLTPIPVAFILPHYNGAGGDLEFSCQQTGARGASWILCALVAMLLVRLRRNLATHAGIIIVSIVLLTPDSAHAELGQVNIGLLGSMYRPDLDSEMLATGEKIFPFYKCFFRKKTSDENGPINPLLGGEVDVHLWDGFGSLQLGLGFGYTFVNGRALKLDSDGNPDCDEPVDNIKVALHMYQIRPQLTYMFDYFAEVFPFVPYIRGALVGHGYMFRRLGKAEPSRETGERVLKPNGFRFGYQAAVGLMLMLDFLEPGSMRTASGQGFLQHVFLKGELSYTKIDSFGQRGYQFSAKDVMGTSWPLMWTFGLVFELP